ncbi:MAG: aminotransferase class V-fold PLP-dependent enzyme [Candidatus Heimdallarchaeota archaeon]|nr:aminotransferase class V-fold PLP-dependent enzyme [Candidatus Heimdallarchaeota archaeon]MBY8993241.1 aminotransferase class V-fold PLP-dependent enzyme [Candidatus Heimdallarchaeota archaeon]
MFNDELVKKIRAAFPRAEKDYTGRKRAFFDNGTGTLVLERAAKAEAKARVDCSANIGANFDESKLAKETVKEGKEAVAEFLNAPSGDTIVSGESATRLLFDVSYAIGKECNGTENVVITELEHYANVSPWNELVRQGKIKEVRFARMNLEDGTLDFDHLQELIDSNTEIVSVTSASNVTGTKIPLEPVRKLAKEADSYFVVDAVHHVPHGLIDVQKIGCDFLVFSGYKIFGSHGSYMYMNPEYMENLRPYKVKPSTNTGPGKWESGTRNQAMFASIKGVMDHFLWISEQVKSQYEGKFKEYSGKRCDYKIAMSATQQNERELSKAVLGGFDDIPGLLNIPKVKIYGITDVNRINERDPTFAFTVDGIPNEDIIKYLWAEGGIATRAENFYSYAVEVFNQQKVNRISLVQYNTLEEVGIFLKALNTICSRK